MFGRAAMTPVPADADLSPIALNWLDTLDLAKLPLGDSPTAFWNDGDIAVAMRMLPNGTFEMAIVLDDSDDVLGPGHRKSWAEWLRLSNLVAFRNEIPTVITTRSLLGTRAPSVASSKGFTC